MLSVWNVTPLVVVIALFLIVIVAINLFATRSRGRCNQTRSEEKVTVDTLLSISQSGVVKEWDLPPSLPEPLVPLNRDHSNAPLQHGGTSVVKRSSSESRRKRILILSPRTQIRPTHVTEDNVPDTVDTLLGISQPEVVKEWDLPPSLPEPLAPVKYEDPGSTHYQHGGTSVMKRGLSESRLSGRKWTLSPRVQTRPTRVTQNKHTVDTLLTTSQPGVVKEWDPLSSLPESLVPVKCKDLGSTGDTSVMKRDSSERGLRRRKRTLSPCVQTTPAHVTENKVTVDTLLSTLQSGVVKEWDLPPPLPEPLVPVKFKDTSRTDLQHKFKDTSRSDLQHKFKDTSRTDLQHKFKDISRADLQHKFKDTSRADLQHKFKDTSHADLQYKFKDTSRSDLQHDDTSVVKRGSLEKELSGHKRTTSPCAQTTPTESKDTVDTLLGISQPETVKEWDPPLLLPEPLVPLKYEDPGGTHFERDGTSVVKSSSTESRLSCRKQALSPCAQTTPTGVTENKEYPVTKEFRIKDEVVGSLLTSGTKYLTKVARGYSVSVQHDRSKPVDFVLKLKGSKAAIGNVEVQIKSVIEELTATVEFDQLVVGEYNLSVMSTDLFKSFCSQFFKDTHVKCMYPSVVGCDLLRQVFLRSKMGHIITLQVAIGQLRDENVDAIVIPADCRDWTMSTKEIRLEYLDSTHDQRRLPQTGEVFLTDACSFPSGKALHVVLPKRWQPEKKADLLAACSATLNYASSKQFGTLSFPALGIDAVHGLSVSNCIDSLLQSIDVHCLKNDKTSLHTVRIVITQDLANIVVKFFDTYTFRALVKSEYCASVSDSSQSQVQQYEWFWQDGKQYSPYSQTICDTLTQAKNLSRNKICNFQVNGKMYVVDLAAMIQTNKSTGYIRKVKCKKFDNEAPQEMGGTSFASASSAKYEVKWYYRDDEGKFTRYSKNDSAKIEGMYQELDSEEQYLEIHSRLYTFDFYHMKQVNVMTDHERDIKREKIPIKRESEAMVATGMEIHSSVCAINLRGPADKLPSVKQKIKEKLQALSVFKSVLLPVSFPDLRLKVSSIVRQNNVSAFISVDEGKSKLSGKSQQEQQVMRIEGAEQQVVDKAVMEVQSEIISFHSKSSPAHSATKYPTEWKPQTEEHVLVELDEHSSERIRVESKLTETMSEAQILSIKRIQNKWLWERYSQHKERMHKKNGGTVNEKELWHGSRNSSADNIYASEEGFDMRYSSEGLWGQANYFAEKARYSDAYAFRSGNGARELLLAMVLTGDSYDCPPDSSLRMPPEKPKRLSVSGVDLQLKQLRYDSVTGVTSGCRVYMTYSNDKAYPAYLISYFPAPKTTPPPSRSSAKKASPSAAPLLTTKKPSLAPPSHSSSKILPKSHSHSHVHGSNSSKSYAIPTLYGLSSRTSKSTTDGQLHGSGAKTTTRMRRSHSSSSTSIPDKKSTTKSSRIFPASRNISQQPPAKLQTGVDSKRLAKMFSDLGSSDSVYKRNSFEPDYDVI